jgi:thiol-disulfide isomerase/thioredoxin
LDPSADSQSNGSEQQTSSTKRPKWSDPPATAEDVLKRMATAYQNASSYHDNGRVRMTFERDGQTFDDSANFAVSLVRPNRIRMQVYKATVVCDGTTMRAKISELPDQVLSREAPKTLTPKSIYGNRILGKALSSGIVGPPLQSFLLLGDDPLREVLMGSPELILAEPGTIDGRDCYRVRLVRAGDAAVFWVDQQSYVLRRLEMPTEQLRQGMLEQGGDVGRVSVVIEFHDAQLDGQVDPRTFEFEMPPGAEVVKAFVPPNPAQLLGKQMPEFNFVDLDGNSVTPESLEGKIVVLDFWASWCNPCRLSLPKMNEVYEQYKDNKNIVWLAVSIDEGPEVDDQLLRKTFEELGVNIPIARSSPQQLAILFHAMGIPTTFVIGSNGLVQDCEVGGRPEQFDVLPKKLARLLAGEDIYEEPLRKYQQQLEEQQRKAEASSDASSPEFSPVEEHEIPRAAIAKRSEPKTMRLSPLWTCTEVEAPGNILVVPQATGPPRLLVVDSWKSVVEVGVDGKEIAAHDPEIGSGEILTMLRTAVGADGKRYFIVFASTQQRFHLLDDQCDLLTSYPENALENPHSGIADVEFGDLTGDGTLKAYVGYWGVVGVQAVSLAGDRLWSNRSVANVLRMAIGSADSQGQRPLVCTNTNGSLVVIDAEGQRQDEVAVGDRLVHWIVSTDLKGDGQVQWCGLTARQLGENVAIGLNLTGEELWDYTLPDGVQPKPIEPIITGSLRPDGQGQWLLPGPDGSIHILAADGTPVDQFNYGAPLTGLATANLNGKPVLLVATPGRLEAWSVQ